MKLLITNTILEDLQTAIEDAFRNEQRKEPDPTDPTYFKIEKGHRTKQGTFIEPDEADLKELISRGEYKIEVAQENLEDCSADDAGYWRGQIRAWRSLVAKAKAVQQAIQNP